MTDAMKSHPLAEIFPLIDDAGLKELADDIHKNGLRQAIVTYEGKILDGRNRLAACKIAGIEPRLVEFTGDDPLSYVISLNLNRRHLDTSQRAMVAAKIATLEIGANQHRVGKFADPPTQAAAAKMMNVSERSVRNAKSVIDSGAPEIIAKMERGEVSVSAAANAIRPATPKFAAGKAERTNYDAEKIGVAELAKLTANRKELYDCLQPPETRWGCDQFIKDTAAATGRSKK
jgi:hypothetical protein